MVFVEERDNAITEAVLNDDWDGVRKYCKKYGINMPEDERIFKAGIYKAAQVCTGLSDQVKDAAMIKCLELGFNPFMFEEPYIKTEKK